MTVKRAYLAGPMRNIKDFNFPAFMDGAARLREVGYEVFNPAEHDMNMGFDGRGHDGDLAAYSTGTGFDLRKALSADLQWICEQSDLIVVLPGWEKSQGARAEVHVAWALGLPVLSLDGAVKEGGVVKSKGWD